MPGREGDEFARDRVAFLGASRLLEGLDESCVEGEREDAGVAQFPGELLGFGSGFGCPAVTRSSMLQCDCGQ